jgi:arylsulfatase A-like enzyme
MRTSNGGFRSAIARLRGTFEPGAGSVARSAAAGAAFGLLAYVLSLSEYGNGGGSHARQAVLDHYVGLLLVTNVRFAAILAVAGAVWGLLAGLALVVFTSLRERRPSAVAAIAVGATAPALAFLQGFCRWLLDSPETVLAFWPYDASRLDGLYDHVRLWMLDAAAIGAASLAGALVLLAAALRAKTWVAARARVLVRPRRLVTLAPLSGALALVPIPFVLASSPAPSPRADPRPNVLIMMSDTLRQDRTERLRDGEPVMPNVLRLAREGTTFRSCFVPIARTTESVVTLMTGAWPQKHGVRSSWAAADALPVPTLSQTFARAGYETVVLGDWSGTDFTKFPMGFERSHLPAETWSLKTFVARGGRLTGLLLLALVPQRVAEWVCPEIVYQPGADASGPVRRLAFAELERVASSPRPFYMQIFTGNTHAPFTPSGVHHRRFSDPAYRGPNRYGLWARTVDDALKLQSRGMLEKDRAQLEAVYDAAARTFDDDVGAYLARLSALGLERNTIVAVLSDHGTAFYERGSFGQGNEIVSDVSNRIPFVLLDPRRPPRVHAVDHVVREVDIMPTLLALAGLEVPATCDGVSVARYRDEPGLDLGLVAYGETGLWIGKQPWQDGEHDFGFPNVDEMVDVKDWSSGLIVVEDRWIRLMIRAQHRMVRDDRWKLLYVPSRSGVATKLYDVSQGDAGGDVAATHPDVVRALMPRLERFLAREPDVWHDPLPERRRTNHSK